MTSAQSEVPVSEEEEMRKLVQEVMSEPSLKASRDDVLAMKGEVQKLRSEFANIRSEFMDILRRSPKPGNFSEAKAASSMPSTPVDNRTAHMLTFVVPPAGELCYGRPVPPFSIRFADTVTTKGLPATKVRCSVCALESDDDVAQLLFGELEVIMRGGFAEFAGLTMGRLPTMKKGGSFRLKVTGDDPTCPYAVVPLFTSKIDVRAKPSAKYAAQMARAEAAAAAAAEMTPGAALMKRKPSSDMQLPKEEPAAKEPVPAPAAVPASTPTSWMERFRPSLKKNRARPDATDGDHTAEVSSLASDLNRVSVDAGVEPSYTDAANEPRHWTAGTPAAPGVAPVPVSLAPHVMHAVEAGPSSHQAAVVGAHMGQVPIAPIGETRQGSSATFQELQKLGSSSLMDIAMTVFANDSAENINKQRADSGLHPGVPEGAAQPGLVTSEPPSALHRGIDPRERQ